MSTFSPIAFILLASATVGFAGELPRVPLTATPRILGREIPRLILTETQEVIPTTFEWSVQGRSLLSLVPAGQFVPVAEDRDGVFFQAANGLGQPQSVTAKPMFRPGGLYIKKTEPNGMYWYFGDARGKSWIDKSPRPLPPEVQKKFLTARAGGSSRR